MLVRKFASTAMKPFWFRGLAGGKGRLLLANGLDDLVGGKDELRTCDGDGSRTARGIGCAQLDAETFEPTARLLSRRRGAGWRKKAELDAFLAGKIVLVLVAGHLAVGAAIDHSDVLRAEPPGDGGAVNGRVAGADDEDAAADMQMGSSRSCWLQ